LDDLVIQTDALTKRYGRVIAVDGLSMEVRRGHVYGLLGPNGSGKTTTMGMLLGLVRPTSGGFSLFGEAGRQEEALRRIGAIVETPSFYPYLSGRQNLAYFQGISGQRSAGELDELLDKVGLLARADDRFQTYSLGMKQRLGLAYALLGDPELLFLDEPTNGMDPAGMAEVRELIRDLAGENRTVILSSHLLNEVEQVCDSVAILSHGRLIAQGDVSELLQERGKPQVRLRTTDDRKAYEILNALAWVDSVSVDNGYLVAGVDPDRSWEITAALSRNEVYVAEMTPSQMSLEQYFLDVTDENSGGNSGRGDGT
jgi:ABC-2 type transport system ATP-binding protein